MKLIKERQYIISDTMCGISASALCVIEKPFQIDVMRKWFIDNYEKPEENTPYDSQEGQYIFIWGGPYNPKEELENEFGDVIPKDVIDELATELSEESEIWSGKNGYNDQIIDYFVDNIVDINFIDNFKKAVRNNINLSKANVDPSAKNSFNRLLYANLITILESFLSDAFIRTINDVSLALRKFVESTPEFSKEKIPFSDIYRHIEEIKEKVNTYLGKVIWHDIPKIMGMYKSALGIEFPEVYKDIIKAVLIRHDIIHRNGITKTGKVHMIMEKDIANLMKKVARLVLDINKKVVIRKIQKEDNSYQSC